MPLIGTFTFYLRRRAQVKQEQSASSCQTVNKSQKPNVQIFKRSQLHSPQLCNSHNFHVSNMVAKLIRVGIMLALAGIKLINQRSIFEKDHNFRITIMQAVIIFMYQHGDEVNQGKKY